MARNANRLLVVILSAAVLLASPAYTLIRFTGKDSTPPTVSLSIPEPTGNNGWYNQPVSVYVYAWDNGKGISNVQVSLGGATWYKRSLTIRKDGTYRVIGRATDKAGNVASTWKVIHVDMTPPVADFTVPENRGVNKWYLQPVKLSLAGTDNLSGVYQTRLTAAGDYDALELGILDAREMVLPGMESRGILPGTEFGEAKAEIEFKETGIYQVNGFVEDLAGNRTPVDTVIPLDMTAPQIEFHSPKSFYGIIELINNAADQGSGVEQVWIDFGGGWQRAGIKQGNWSSFWNTKDLKDGEYVIQAKAMDRAGNITSTAYPVTVLNHTWPIFAICGVLFSLGLAAMYDPRRQAFQELTISLARYAHMDRSARELERKMND